LEQQILKEWKLLQLRPDYTKLKKWGVIVGARYLNFIVNNQELETEDDFFYQALSKNSGFVIWKIKKGPDESWD